MGVDRVREREKGWDAFFVLVVTPSCSIAINAAVSSLRIKLRAKFGASRGKNSCRNCKYWSHRDDSSMSKEWRRANTFFFCTYLRFSCPYRVSLATAATKFPSLNQWPFSDHFVGQPVGERCAAPFSNMAKRVTALASTINDTHLTRLSTRRWRDNY